MLNAFSKLTRLSDEGNHWGGNLLISVGILNAEENIQKNGKIMMIAPTVRKKYMKKRAILLRAIFSPPVLPFLLNKKLYHGEYKDKQEQYDRGSRGHAVFARLHHGVAYVVHHRVEVVKRPRGQTMNRPTVADR